MNEDKNADAVRVEKPAQEKVETRYVGFCDILGFSNRILTDFDRTLEVYTRFGDSLSNAPIKGAEVTMYSDAVLVTSQSFTQVLCAIQTLWFVALMHDLMLRGAIAKGRHWERHQGNHMLVASDALVRAVKLERSVGVPAVEVADDVEIPDELWLYRFQNGVLATPILHFRDRNIVNPFNRWWFMSASTRASQLMTESPQHRDKYLWFLSLHQSVNDGKELIPPDVLARFLREGILTPKK
jgi:hypothetical protein